MKAIVVREFGEPEVMKVEDVELAQPTGKQVLVKIEAAGVNPVDTYLRTGIHAHAPNLPYTPGKDGAGTVAAIGPDVTKWNIGDRVYTANSLTGTYAEYCLCNEVDLGRLPENTSFEQGSGIWTPYATAYRALFQKAGLKAGETVLIHGASGGVGLAAVQWAVGVRTLLSASSDSKTVVIGTASSDAGKQLILNNGADAVFDHTDEDHLGEIREFTGGKGVDVIIEMLANVNLERDFEAIAMFGRIVIVGNRGSLNFTPRLAMTNETTIYGMSLFNSSQDARDEIHAAIFDGLTNGELSPVVSQTFSLEDSPAAHKAVIESHTLGKIILVP